MQEFPMQKKRTGFLTIPIANCEVYSKAEIISLFLDMKLLADKVRLQGMERVKTRFDSRGWKVPVLFLLHFVA